ncbi:MAG: PilZ domain-containing protein [Leptospiraceae bacterium]|nr:PilZ domain-containing protein [Leptospiraceae bacterium]MDW8307413.1 PilZ domain-containing protein [Leptospiraceae bacterium]
MAEGLMGYVAPKVISWFGLPSCFGEQERFELLKRDIFLHEARFEDLSGLWAINSRFTAYAFNLDKILEYLPFPRLAGVMVLAKRLIDYICKFCPHNSIVHTRILNEEVREIFREHGIVVLQQNLDYRPKAFEVLRRKLFPLIHPEERPVRKFVRVHFTEDLGCRATIKIEEKEGLEIFIPGILKDLSLNGAGIRVPDSRLFRRLALRTPVRVYIRHGQANFQIATAFVTRRDEEKREVGINFNIADETFISHHDAHILSRVVYSHLHEFLTKKIKAGHQKIFEFRQEAV